MKVLLAGFILLGLVSMAIYLPGANAAAELPSAASFSYGAWLDLRGQQLDPSINAAAGLGLDWVAVDFDWAAMMPSPNLLPDLSLLNSVMAAARQSNMQVMLSLTSAPSWAFTPNGPDPRLTASLALSLSRLYRDTLKAIELYPAANTLQVWGTSPDPVAYAKLFQKVDAALKADGLSITLVASLAPGRQPGDMTDWAYLDGLYQAGAAGWMPVLGVRLPGLTGDPMADPNGGSGMVLRHYEILRRVMLQYDHATGSIWLTGFSWPSDPAYFAPDQQAQWLNRAFKLLRSQLFIGAAFFQQLNPPATGVDPVTGSYASLILPQDGLHPACIRLGQLTTLDKSAHTVNFQSAISKKTPLKSMIKP